MAEVAILVAFVIASGLPSPVIMAKAAIINMIRNPRADPIMIIGTIKLIIEPKFPNLAGAKFVGLINGVGVFVGMMISLLHISIEIKYNNHYEYSNSRSYHLRWKQTLG